MIAAPAIDENLFEKEGKKLITRFKSESLCKQTTSIMTRNEVGIYPHSTFIKNQDNNSNTNYLFQIKKILSDYEFIEENLVLLYINKNPKILDVLIAAPPKLHSFFNENIEVKLSVFENPEEETQILNANIFHEFSIEDGFVREQKFFDEWFEPSFPSLSSKILFREFSKDVF